MSFKPHTPPTARRVPVEQERSRSRVLYVEDDETSFELTRTALEARFDLMRAYDAETAFELWREEKFEAVLMDIELSDSDLDGIQIARILKGNFVGDPPHYARNVQPCTVPIIFVTAYSARYGREDLIAIGGDEVVHKPVNFGTLSMAISRLLLRGAHGARKLADPSKGA